MVIMWETPGMKNTNTLMDYPVAVLERDPLVLICGSTQRFASVRVVIPEVTSGAIWKG